MMLVLLKVLIVTVLTVASRVAPEEPKDQNFIDHVKAVSPNDFDMESNMRIHHSDYSLVKTRARRSEVCAGTLIRGQCLIFNMESLNWQEAATACSAAGGRLAIPADPAAVIAPDTYGNVRFWVGGSDFEEEGTWKWSNGDTIPLDHKDFPWGANQPDDWRGGEDCLEAIFNGGYNDISCTSKRPYICEPGPPRPNCECGQKKVGSFIINGKETEVLEYPWQAGLVFTGGSRTLCGGSLNNSNWVLSAAHCTIGKSASSIQVILSEHDVTVSEDYTERFNVERIVNHPEYNTNPWTNGHDVSLLELDGRVNFKTSQARPICLPTGDDSYENALATLTGFGRTGWGDPQSNFLREVDIHVISNSKCSKLYSQTSNFDTMICAGETDGSGGCKGDSGGPLIYKGDANHYFQIGVVSYGRTGCYTYGVFARVTSERDWITSFTNTGNPDICSPP